MPGVKANTQSKGGEKKAVGGGGSAGMAARLGATAEKRECVLCKALFNVRAPRAQIMEHVESKHAKQGFDACFPGFVDPK